MPYQLILAHPSPTVLKVLRMVFPEDQFDIRCFQNGLDIKENMPPCPADAVLLSLSLPPEDGLSAAKYLRSLAEYRDVPLLLLQGAFDRPDLRRLESLDYHALIQEPFDSEALAETIRRLVGGEQDPESLPEEPDGERLELSVELDDCVREKIKSEILEAEREVEKRIRARLWAELKEYVDKE